MLIIGETWYGVQGNCVLSSQFFYKYKTVLKKLSKLQKLWGKVINERIDERRFDPELIITETGLWVQRSLLHFNVY